MSDSVSGGTLALDTSALLRRYVADRHRSLVLEAMAEAGAWAASALARSELMLALHQAASGPLGQRSAWAAVRDDWEAVWEIPVDVVASPGPPRSVPATGSP